MDVLGGLHHEYWMGIHLTQVTTTGCGLGFISLGNEIVDVARKYREAGMPIRDRAP